MSSSKISKVIILGGGITGLSCAYYLLQNNFSDFLLLESSTILGGKIKTLKIDDLIIEQGADSIVSTKPDAIQLINEIGLENEIIYPKTRAFSFLGKDGFIDPPKNIQNLVPTDIEDFLKYPNMSELGKKLVLDEVNSPSNLGLEDESFANFISRRFGKEYLEKYAGPLFQGIYGTNTENMSVNSTFPIFRKIEREYGSLTAFYQHHKIKNGVTESRSPFIGLKNGIGSLVDNLIKFIPEENILLNTKIEKISPLNNGFTLFGSGFNLSTGNLISTLHPNELFNLLGNKDFSEYLPLSGSIILTYQFESKAVEHLPNSTGFISLDDYNGNISASTWTSRKWEQRSDGNTELFRFFVKRKELFSNENLSKIIENEFMNLFQIEKNSVKNWKSSWEGKMPMYEVGHSTKIQMMIENLKNYGLIFQGGCAINGVGIPDCIKQGKEMAMSVLSSI